MSKYSVILPVRNGGNHVIECVASVLSQTNTNFNLHILDNCSTDGTSEWLKSLTDERIIYIPAATSLTIEENWGRIKDIEKNEFITLIGHDDILLPDYLQTMEQLIAENPNASLYQTHFNYIDENGIFIKKCKPMQQKQDAALFLKNFLTNSIDIMGTGFMMRSKDYDAIGGIPVHYPNLLFADMELWLKLTNINYLIISTNSVFQYRLHLSTTKATSTEKLLQAFEKMVYFLNEFKATNKTILPVIETHSLHFVKHHCISFCHRLLKTDMKNRTKITVSYIVQKCNSLVHILSGKSNVNFNIIPSIIVAKVIDSNAFFRRIFFRIKGAKL